MSFSNMLESWRDFYMLIAFIFGFLGLSLMVLRKK